MEEAEKPAGFAFLAPPALFSGASPQKADFKPPSGLGFKPDRLKDAQQGRRYRRIAFDFPNAVAAAQALVAGGDYFSVMGISLLQGRAFTNDEVRDAIRMRGVIERHIDRFAFREAPLTYEWTETEEAGK